MNPEAAAQLILKPIDATVHKKVSTMLRHLMSRNDSLHFNKPVDYITLKIYEYPKLIKEPMDLGTVLQRLEADADKPYDQKRYQWLEEMAHDMRLVWKNAFLFNKPDHFVFKAARRMAIETEKKLATLHSELEAEAEIPCPLIARCQLLLSDIRRNPLSEWFRREDDWKKLGEDYILRLTSGEPMDLNAVQRWLDEVAREQGDAAVDEFARKVRLVWKNAIDFNGKHTLFGIIAHLLQETFDRRLTQIRAAPAPPRVGEPLPDREGMPPFERKRELLQTVALMPLKDASVLVRKIEEICPAASATLNPAPVGPNAPPKRVRVDMDALDIASFDQVEALAREREAAQFAALGE